MWPFYPFFPWWGYRPPVAVRRPVQLRTFKVQASLVSNGSTTVNDLAIDPVIFRQLPNECLLLFDIPVTLPASRLPLPVNVVVTGAVNTRTLPVVDSEGTNITGTDIPNPTQVNVYLNKSDNIFRILDFEAQAPATEDAQVQSLSTKAKTN